MTTPTTPPPTLPRRPRSSWLSPRTLITIAVIVAAYAYGWQITKVDPWILFRDWERGIPLTTSLFRPAFFAPVETISEDSLSLALQPPDGQIEPPLRDPRTGPELSASTRIVHRGETITLTGTRFPPNAPGTLTWEGNANQDFAIADLQSDAAGNFSYQLLIPDNPDRFPPGFWFVHAVFRKQETWFGTIPAWGLNKQFQDLVIPAMIETVFLALMGTTLSVFIAIPLSFFGARNLMYGTPTGRVIYTIVRTAFNVIRSIEVLILAVIFAVIVGFGSYAGILAIALHGVGAVGKLYSEAIESIDSGMIEAVRATGAGPLQTVMYGVVPQVVPQFIAFTVYRWDINVRMATVLGLVGGGGIGGLLTQFIALLQWQNAAAVIWLIVAVVMIMDFASGAAREQVV